MAKTKAEIQRAYRERKKQKEGEAYLIKERERIKGYYIPISERSKKEQRERRQKVRKWVKKHRDGKKKQSTEERSQQQCNINNNVEQSDEISSSTDKAHTNKLIVKLPYQDTKVRTRKRISRATAKCRRQLKKLEEKNEKIHRNYKRVSKKYERLVKKTEKKSTNINSSDSSNNTFTITAEVHAEYTPRKRTDAELRSEGVSSSKVPKAVKDKLVFANVLTEEINTAWKNNSERGKAAISKIISGRVIKKYRMIKKLSIKTGIDRHHLLGKSKKCDNIPKRSRLLEKHLEIRKDIQTFLERDENSRVMPGKNDKVKTEKGHTQKRVLNDNMRFLHLKYKLENSSNISFSTFCRMRPKHIALTRYLSRNKCLCQKHQNMALCLKSMKSAGAEVTLNPDEFARLLQGSTTVNNVLSQVKEEEVNYSQWKKVEMNNGKTKTKIVETKVKREEFITTAQEKICEFEQHVHRVKTQYQAINTLKENLPVGHAIAQMDFAENYTCSSADEVQSAYWNSTSVTLHPVVVYYNSDEGSLLHKNLVYVSDVLGHNIGTVYTILKCLIPEVKKVVSNLQWIHYWTDSPSSQYRNKTAFYLIANHDQLLGANATWNYFETGHGKGCCDGVGGTSKRTADLAIRQGKITIQDPMDFYEKVQNLHISAEYRFVTSQDIEVSRAELAEINKTLVAVRGTLQIHQVFASTDSKVKTCVTSCYCKECIHGNTHDYTESPLLKRGIRNAETEQTDNVESPSHAEIQSEGAVVGSDENSSESTNNMQVQAENSPVEASESDWVAVLYEKDWHIGQVIGIDEDDELEVSFLRPTTSLSNRREHFKWPAPPGDLLNVKRESIICKISEPLPMGRSGRSFSVTFS